MNILTDVLSSVVGIENAVYVSVPITTGEEFLRWYTENGRNLKNDVYNEHLRKNVIEKNIASANEFITRVKQVHSGIIIQPTTLDVPEWTQLEYHKFWGDVIQKYVNKIFFKNGWYLSKGCTYEFLQTIKKSIPAIDENFQLIGVEKGIQLINITISRYSQLDIETDFFEEIILQLHS